MTPYHDSIPDPGPADRLRIVGADPADLEAAARLLAAAAYAAFARYLGRATSADLVTVAVLGEDPDGCLCHSDAVLANLLRAAADVRALVDRCDASTCRRRAEGGAA